jgi:hypothetical protein
VEDPAPRRAAAAVARGQALDPWNTPVAWQPLTAPVVDPIQEAGVSAEPAVDNK